MTDHDKKSDIKEDSKGTLTHKDKTKIISEIIKGLPVIIAAIIGAAAVTTIGVVVFINIYNNNNNENHSDSTNVNNNNPTIVNNNNIYLPSETEHKDETSESTTTTYSDTVLYEETSAFSTVPSYTQPPSTSIAYTEPSYNTETSIPYKTESSYNYSTSTTNAPDDINDVWDILLNDTSIQKNSTTQKSSVNETTVSEEIWSGYVYQVALEKQKPNLLRFTVQGNLDIFSLQGEQKWETSIKSNGLFYAARLTTIGKEILSNKVYSFEHKNDGYYYYDTDIPISSYYDSTRDVFIIEVIIDDQDTFESASLELNTVAIIHDFYG